MACSCPLSLSVSLCLSLSLSLTLSRYVYSPAASPSPPLVISSTAYCGPTLRLIARASTRGPADRSQIRFAGAPVTLPIRGQAERERAGPLGAV